MANLCRLGSGRLDGSLFADLQKGLFYVASDKTPRILPSQSFAQISQQSVK